jgi:hypothetical protein
LVDKTASKDPSSVIEAESARRDVFSSLFTVGGSEIKSSTKILDELRARRIWPFGEKMNRKASPPGKAVDEFAL